MAVGEAVEDQFSRRSAMMTVAGAAGLSACATASNGASALPSDGAEGAGDPEAASIARFALNIESWWRELPLSARMVAAAQAGFSTAEMWALGEGERDPDLLRQQAKDAGITIIHCTVNVPGQMAAASRADVLSSVTASLDMIEKLGARYATIVGHRNVDGMSKAAMLASYQEHIAAIAPLFEAANVTLCIEPFNPFNHPGFFIYGAGDAVQMCREINSAHVKLNWDLFHMQRHEGNVVHHLREGIDQAGLLQIADSPARREPGTGEMNYAYILGEAAKLGFTGPVGLECFPLAGQEDTAVANIRKLAASL